MKIFFYVILGSFLLWITGLGFFSEAYALNLGTNITIYDGSGTGTGWYGKYEDQEVEPGCVASQRWDLEGFFLKGSELQVVGGFDFLKGNEQIFIGDIYIDIDGIIGTSNTYSNGNNSVNENFGYEYVIDLDFSDKDSLSYKIIALNDSSFNYTVYWQKWSGHPDGNSNSNPYRYVSGGTEVGSGTFAYIPGLSDSQVANLEGGTHYALTGIDVGFISGEDFTAHLTMGCGNDNLMGQGTAPVPEPATLVLMGMGLAGLSGFSRRKINKKA